MKKHLYYLLFPIASLPFCAVTFAQSSDAASDQYHDEVDVLYNLSHIGHQLLFNYNHHWNRHVLVAGLKYHFTSSVHQPYSRFAGWTFYKPGIENPLRNSLNKIGLSLSYEYHIFKTPSYAFDPYIFAQFQPSRSFSVGNFNSTTIYAGRGPYTILENVIGVGVQRNFYKNFSFNASIGLGPAIFIYEGVIGFQGGKPPDSSEYNFTETAIILRVGVSYELK